MESYQLREIHMRSKEKTSTENGRVYTWLKKEPFCDVYIEDEHQLTFKYITEDQMDRFEFHLSVYEGKLTFYWFAWDGSKYIHMQSSNWIHSDIFNKFIKNKYFVKQNKMMFYINRVKNKNIK
ncbi:hypothetical protein [Bacillus sp. NPDC077027]|uniref:hypothetical protein n=1 Tax=Bacillus sp. NPDC077027 TaxID=3390548 RepID=UPI003CFEE429